MIYPSYKEVLVMSQDYKVIPIAKEIYADTQTPIQMFLQLKEYSRECFLLESVSDNEKWGRYSFIGISPTKTIRIKKQSVSIKSEKNEEYQAVGDPMEVLSKVLDEYRSPKIREMPNLSGGIVGYFAYDSVRYIENKLGKPPHDDLEMPDIYFMVCKEIIAFDHLKQKVIVMVNIKTAGNLEKNYEEGGNKIEKIIKLLRKQSIMPTPSQLEETIKIKSNLEKNMFLENVKQAKQAIQDGEIFQVVLSQRWEVENAPEPFDTYRMLRLNNPSPYMYYFQLEGHSIVGSSPEMLVKVEDDRVETRPIAGTIRRGRDKDEDQELEEFLRNDEKEKAEHIMLVDLGRNDIGKVCKPSTVKVEDFMRVEKYSKVMHLVTDINGKLREDKQSLDVLRAVLPAGTLSGAPKVRAMELIDEIEPTQRGLYGGAVGYIGFNGDLDTCIAIRTILYKGQKAYIQAGAGIVADSIPEKEFEETEHKAKALLQAIQEKGESI